MADDEQLSKRPGRRRAGSTCSGRLVVASTKIWPRASMPSSNPKAGANRGFSVASRAAGVAPGKSDSPIP